jgi:antitoxin ParD1/3/4
MRLLQEQEQLRQMRLEALRKDIAVGLEQEARGEFVPLDAEWIKAEGRRRAKAGNR